MFFYKPVFRTLILSLILAFLVIYLGIKYHWVNFFNSDRAINGELIIPEKEEFSDATKINQLYLDEQKFNLEIVDGGKGTPLIESMNKEQIAEQCTNLLSRTIKDDLTLELAVTNCVVSNYQETYQNLPDSNEKIKLENQKKLLSNRCGFEINQFENYSTIEKQLLVGICISDQLSQ